MSTTKRALLALGATVVVLVLLGLGMIVLLSWLFSGFGTTFETANFETLEDWENASGFERSLGLEFPPSTSDVRLASDGFQEPLYQIRFTIDRDELSILESSIGCDGLLSQEASTPPQAVITEEVEWWQPESAAVYQQCSGGQAPGRVLDVFVDQTEADTAEVYVVAIFL
ncbi:MAG: hypothetical protein ACR2QO_22620 [Acidimicrobiales bacterium]